MTSRLLVDTGPLVALYRKKDQHHQQAVAQFDILSPPALTCWPVIVEAAYLLRNEQNAVARLLASFGAGLLQLLPLDESEFDDLSKIIRRFRSLGVQLADAALVHLAEREEIDTVFTFDRRDFSIYRTASNRSFTIVP